MDGAILFLDLARQTGWAYGRPGMGCVHGSISLAPPGGSPAYVFAGLNQFLRKLITDHGKPSELCFETPLDPRHMGPRTNAKTARLLIGLPAVAEMVGVEFAINRITEARATEIRSFLLPKRPPKAEMKRAISQQLRTLGYAPQDDNAADAIAGWLFLCAVRAPGSEMTAPMDVRHG